MKINIRSNKSLYVYACLLAAAVGMSAPVSAKGLIGFKFESNRPNCLYKVGEEALVTITATNGSGEAVKEGFVGVEWDNYGRRNLGVIRKWDFAEKNPIVVKATLDKPGFIRLRVRGRDSKGAPIGGLWGVGFDPEKIRPATLRPADFDSFWENAIAKFNKEVPINARIEKDEVESAKRNGAFECYRLTFDTVPQGRVIRGQLTVPKGKGPWPVLMNVPGAGSGTWSFARMPGRAYLTLNVLDYPRVPNGKDDVKKLYADQNIAWGSKGGMGRTWYFEGDVTKAREEYFYYGAILGINRAVDYVAALPFIDTRDFRYSGQSQGGAFGIILAALNKHLTRAQIGEPAITDISGFLADKRQSGWPMLPEKFEGKPCYDGLMKILPYFDCAHFAPRIKIPTRWYVGFIDELCPPHAVWAGYNCLSTADKKMLNFPGLGHGVPSQLYRTAVKEVEASW